MPVQRTEPGVLTIPSHCSLLRVLEGRTLGAEGVPGQGGVPGGEGGVGWVHLHCPEDLE